MIMISVVGFQGFSSAYLQLILIFNSQSSLACRNRCCEPNYTRLGLSMRQLALRHTSPVPVFVVSFFFVIVLLVIVLFVIVLLAMAGIS
jgi:hypothetical protein